MESEVFKGIVTPTGFKESNISLVRVRLCIYSVYLYYSNEVENSFTKYILNAYIVPTTLLE